MNAPLSPEMPARARFRVEDFLAIDAAGVLAELGRTELIDGDIIKMNPQHRPHGWTTFRLAREIENALAAAGSALGVLVKVTVGMPPHDAPEPDITVTSEPNGNGIIPLASVHLLVEVADATLGFDLGGKATLYARHGVPEYWVIDLNGRRIVRMSQPAAAGYRQADEIPFSDAVTAVTIAGLTVATTELLTLRG